MLRPATLLLALAALFSAPAALAQRTIIVETVVEEWVSDRGGERFVLGTADVVHGALPDGIARYGPFRVLDANRAALVGATGIDSPAQFAAMLAAHPDLEALVMVEAPGTANDRANLALGRAIRAAGLETRVPANGSVRSGAVELFLAGTRRHIANGASFAVHAWLDELGREASDLPPEAPAHRAYLDYYADVGFAPDEARAFYAMTNAVPHHSARWLDADEMRSWLPEGTGRDAAPSADPQLAYADLDLDAAGS